MFLYSEINNSLILSIFLFFLFLFSPPLCLNLYFAGMNGVVGGGGGKGCIIPTPNNHFFSMSPARLPFLSSKIISPNLKL